jgi:replication-associated recombination protein RarA
MINSYFLDYSKRYFFLINETSDNFFDSALRVFDLKDLLYSHLKQVGYNRIVFFNQIRKFYFYDEVSLYNTMHLDAPVSSNVVESNRQIIGGGPLSKLKTTSAQLEQKKTESKNLTLGRMKDSAVLKRLNELLNDRKLRTAIIIDNADDFIRNFGKDEGIGGQIQAFMNEWSNLSFNNENIVIFIFPNKSYVEKILEDYKNLPLFQTHLSRYFEKNNLSKHVISIEKPDLNEVLNFINYFRIINKVKVNFLEKDLILKEFKSFIMRNDLNMINLFSWLKSKTENNKLIDKEFCVKEMRAGLKSSVFERLDSMIGLHNFKDLIDTLKKSKNLQKSFSDNNNKSIFYSRIEPRPKVKSENPFLNYVLLGSPGTGKSTAASLLGEVLFELDYLSSGHTIIANQESLIADHVGGTAIKTASAIDSALGGVLFIDEAYTLFSNEKNDGGSAFKNQAVDTLVGKMTEEKYKGNVSIVLAGYTNEMNELLGKNNAASNSGFLSRVKLIHLEDYNAEELFKIAKHQIEKSKKYHPSESFLKILEKYIKYYYENRNFDVLEPYANARPIVRLVDEDIFSEIGKLGYISTVNKNGQVLPVADEHHLPEKLRNLLNKKQINLLEQAQIQLEELIGLDEFKETVKELITNVQMGGKDTLGTYMFLGNPGTGKTTAARLFALILKELKVIKSNQVVEVFSNDFMGQYQGHTNEKVDKKLKEALGGVLFIDEAHEFYQPLNDNPYKKEAITKISHFMYDKKDEIVVIFSGYKDETLKLFEVERGLKSRIRKIIEFQDYTLDELVLILEKQLISNSLKATNEFKEEIKNIFIRKLSEKAKNGSGNGRLVERIVDQAKIKMRNRLFKKYGSIERVPELEINIVEIEDLKGVD